MTRCLVAAFDVSLLPIRGYTEWIILIYTAVKQFRPACDHRLLYCGRQQLLSASILFYLSALGRWCLLLACLSAGQQI